MRVGTEYQATVPDFIPSNTTLNVNFIVEI